MKIKVDHIYRLDIRLLRDSGWSIVEYPEFDGTLESIRDRAFGRRCSGLEMEKDFPSIRDAIREYESVLKCDVIEETDQCGCSVHTFWCDEIPGRFVSGWECGKYLFEKWARTPRMTLEMLNTERHL